MDNLLFNHIPAPSKQRDDIKVSHVYKDGTVAIHSKYGECIRTTINHLRSIVEYNDKFVMEIEPTIPELIVVPNDVFPSTVFPQR